MKTMFMGVIIVAIIALIVLIIAVAIPYQEQLKQESLATQGIAELNNCMTILNEIEHNPFIDQTRNEMIVQRHGDCIDNAIEKYGTDEIKEEYGEMKSIQSVQPSYEYGFEKPTVSELEEIEFEYEKKKAEFIHVCKELFIGQIEKMNTCISNADIAISFDYP